MSFVFLILYLGSVFLLIVVFFVCFLKIYY